MYNILDGIFLVCGIIFNITIVQKYGMNSRSTAINIQNSSFNNLQSDYTMFEKYLLASVFLIFNILLPNQAMVHFFTWCGALVDKTNQKQTFGYRRTMKNRYSSSVSLQSRAQKVAPCPRGGGNLGNPFPHKVLTYTIYVKILI